MKYGNTRKKTKTYSNAHIEWDFSAVISVLPLPPNRSSTISPFAELFCNQSNSTGMQIMNDNMNEDDFEKFLYYAFKCMYDYSRDGAPIYVFHSDVGGYSFRKAFVDAGYKMAECLIWLKNQFVLGRQDYQWRHEPILYGWREGSGHTWYGGRSQSTIFVLIHIVIHYLHSCTIRLIIHIVWWICNDQICEFSIH